MAFPRLNAFSYWVYLAAGLFIYASLLAGAAPNDGWFNYVPYALREYNPGAEHRLLCAGHDLPRRFDDGRRGEFRRHLPAHARARHVAQPRSHPHLGNGDDLRRQPSRRPVGQPRVLSLCGRTASSARTSSGRTAAAIRCSGSISSGCSRIPGSMSSCCRRWGLFPIPCPSSAAGRSSATRPVVIGTVTTMALGFGVWLHHMFATGIPVPGARLLQRRVLRDRHSERDRGLCVDRDDLDRPPGAHRSLSLLSPASS